MICVFFSLYRNVNIHLDTCSSWWTQDLSPAIMHCIAVHAGRHATKMTSCLDCLVTNAPGISESRWCMIWCSEHKTVIITASYISIMLICIARLCETVTPLMFSCLCVHSCKEMRFQVPPKTFRLDRRITQRIRQWVLNRRTGDWESLGAECTATKPRNIQFATADRTEM